MSDDDKETSPTLSVAPIAVRGRVRHFGSFSKDNQPERRGRTAGSLNKITRTLRDAVIAAADELGRIKYKDWSKQLEGEPENGMKGFFKVLAVKELRTFGIILARMIPAQAYLMTSNVPTYLTEEQMRAELREAGLPEDIVKFMRPVDARLIDPDELDENPYEDPEAEGDGDVIDVTPNDTGK